uniref:Uncharacterized protein n=1 Tax=Mycolicibacterium phage Alyssa1 TaxID=3240801 RepID=A0AB39U1Q9_9CAUD
MTYRHSWLKKKQTAPVADTGAVFIGLMKSRLTQPDPRSHAEFLADMRAKQSAGRLANPATAALLDRLERAIR